MCYMDFWTAKKMQFFRKDLLHTDNEIRLSDYYVVCNTNTEQSLSS